ncbi:MAG: NUDIX domain-containing protein [Candidatus Dormibacteria bacterium]
MSEPAAERLQHREEVFAGRLLHVYRDEVALSGGRTAVREVIRHPGAVAVVALDAHGRTLLVRQWRHAVGRAVWEVCAGTREPGETPSATAARELAEETGYQAAAWRQLGAGCVSPGYTDELIHLFLAEQLTPGPTATDADEEVDSRFFTQPEVLELVRQGGTDLKTLAGLALAGWLRAAG